MSYSNHYPGGLVREAPAYLAWVRIGPTWETVGGGDDRGQAERLLAQRQGLRQGVVLPRGEVPSENASVQK